MSQLTSLLSARIQLAEGACLDDEIERLRPLDTAEKSDVTFFAPTSKRAFAELQAKAVKSSAGAILVKEFSEDIQATQIECAHPLLAAVSVAEHFYVETSFNSDIHETAVIHETASVGENCTVGPYCVVGSGVTIGENSKLHAHVILYSDASVGKNCEIHANVVIRERVIVDDNCLLQPGAVIGGEGFGYVPDPELGHRRIPHLGNVHLKKYVDVGANSSVDRATFGTTTVGASSKLDSLVQIGHNNVLGERVLVCAMSGIGGSGTIGSDSIIGGHVGVADHVNIASKVRIGGKTGVSSDVVEPGDYLGSFKAEPARQYWRELASIRMIPKFIRQLKELKQKVSELESS